MQVNKISKTRSEFVATRSEFADFLQELSHNHFDALNALTREAGHAVIRITDGYGSNGTTPSFHVVADPVVYQKLQNLVRADYFRNAIVLGEGDIAGLFSSSSAEHWAGKLAIMPQFRKDSIASSYPLMAETVGAELKRWKDDGSAFPFASAQTIAARFFSQFAFGAVPSEQESLAIVQSSLITTEVGLRVATDPRHFRCLSLDQDIADPFSSEQHEVLTAKRKWIERVVTQRIETDRDREFSEEPYDLLDFLIRHAVVPQDKKVQGTLGSKFDALGSGPQNKARKQVAKAMSHLLTAATETTPTFIAYAIYMVAYNPDLQARLRDQLGQYRHELCERRQPINISNLLKAPLLQKVISDALIQYTPMPFSYPRQVDHETEVDGFKFREGDIVVFNLSRLEKPFHAGEYACAGQKVAEFEASVTVASVFESVRLNPYPGMPIPEPKRNSIVGTPIQDVPLMVDSL